MSAKAITNGMIPEPLFIPFCLALNACSSIGIVFVNKLVFRDYGFPYGTLLTVIHFVVTFALLYVCLLLKMFEFKRVPISKIVPLCLSFCGFVGLTNLSLVHNSVGFYQLMKVLTTPLLVILQTLFYGQHFSNVIKASLVLICVGVAIATVTDTQANFLGTVIAVSALFVTCQYQIWVGTKQKELECNSFQLLFYQAPISALMLAPISIFADNLLENFQFPCWDTVMMVLLSAVLAFLVNISIFLVIGKTSPVTYNVLGHFKLCIILLIGFYFFDNDLSFEAVIGVSLTLTGVFWYTHLKQKEQEHKSKQQAEVTEEKAEILSVKVDGADDDAADDLVKNRA